MCRAIFYQQLACVIRESKLVASHFLFARDTELVSGSLDTVERPRQSELRAMQH